MKHHKNRLLILALSLFCLFSILLWQFYKIQIVEGEKWTKIGNRQHYLVLSEPFRRGRFFANTSLKKGHPDSPVQFVFDIQKYHLHIDPASIPKEHRTPISAAMLKHLTCMPEEEETLKTAFQKKSRNRRVAKWLNQEEKDAINSWWNPYAKKHKIARNAVFFVKDYMRSYPFGQLLGPVLHTVQSQKDAITKQALPTGGLELSLNQYLKGKQGKRRLIRSPRNRFDTGEMLEEPIHGADIYLTINHVLQAIMEEELEKGVIKGKAKGGWAIMMAPKTGEILAFAQFPHFNPQEYRTFFNDPLLIEHTHLKGLTDAHEPGSVMKPLTLAAALKGNEELRTRGEAPLFDPAEMLNTSSGKFAGRRDLREIRFHQYLNMDMALQKSGNIYMGRIAERIVNCLGNAWYRDVLHHSFGIGKKTGVELPGESRGILPTPGKVHPNGRLEWSVPTPISLALGHNLQASSMQIVRAYAILANGGYLVEPTLVRKIVRRGPDGKETLLVDNTSLKRLKSFPRVLSHLVTERVVRAMKYATKPGGSGRRADVWGYTEAGKTGSAEKVINGIYSKKQHVSSFIGFTPIQETAFILLVTLDEPEYGYIPGIGRNQYGGVSAAPIFQKIAQRSLEYLGVPPDDPYGYPTWDVRYDPTKADWIAETHQLQKMYEKWNKSS